MGMVGGGNVAVARDLSEIASNGTTAINDVTKGRDERKKGRATTVSTAMLSSALAFYEKQAAG
eukprot:4417385-Pleurochrysis_carterae.AAC.6